MYDGIKRKEKGLNPLSSSYLAVTVGICIMWTKKKGIYSDIWGCESQSLTCSSQWVLLLWLPYICIFYFSVPETSVILNPCFILCSSMHTQTVCKFFHSSVIPLLLLLSMELLHHPFNVPCFPPPAFLGLFYTLKDFDYLITTNHSVWAFLNSVMYSVKLRRKCINYVPQNSALCSLSQMLCCLHGCKFHSTQRQMPCPP